MTHGISRLNAKFDPILLYVDMQPGIPVSWEPNGYLPQSAVPSKLVKALELHLTTTRELFQFDERGRHRLSVHNIAALKPS
jgi:hypothetical protein